MPAIACWWLLILILGDSPPCFLLGTVPTVLLRCRGDCSRFVTRGVRGDCPPCISRGTVPSIRRALEVLALDLLEQFLDPRLVGDRLIELEGQLRHATHVQPLGQRTPDERHRALERPRRLLPFGRITEHRVVNPRLRQIIGDAHSREREKPDARVANLAPEDVADFLANLLSETTGPRHLDVWWGWV